MRIPHLFIAVMIGSALPCTSSAQRAASMRLGISAHTPASQSDISKRARVDSTRSHLENTLHGALVGSAVGAGGGLLVAFVETQFGGVTDHSEDAMAYIALPAFGAFIGYVVGGIVGFLHN